MIPETPSESPPAIGKSPVHPLTLLKRCLYVGGTIFATGLILMAMTVPVTRGREDGRRVQCKSNLKQIGMALRSYHDVYGSFPPAYTTNASGHRLHSWRTLILPCLDQQSLYESIDLSKPWDDPANKKARETPMPTYCCPSQPIIARRTSYLGVATADGVFAPGKIRTINDITRGPSNVIMVVDAGHGDAVEWMDPRDADDAVIDHIAEIQGMPHIGIVQTILGDGTMRVVPNSDGGTTIRKHLPIDHAPLPDRPDDFY